MLGTETVQVELTLQRNPMVCVDCVAHLFRKRQDIVVGHLIFLWLAANILDRGSSGRPGIAVQRC